MIRLFSRSVVICVCLFVLHGYCIAQTEAEVKADYTKLEQSIPMRDGVKLFSAIYMPKDSSRAYPIMITRTPYSINPYGPDRYRDSLGPSLFLQQEKYIFVYQD